MAFAIGPCAGEGVESVARHGCGKPLARYPAIDDGDDGALVEGAAFVDVAKEARYSVGGNEVIDPPSTDAKKFPVTGWRDGFAIA